MYPHKYLLSNDHKIREETKSEDGITSGSPSFSSFTSANGGSRGLSSSKWDFSRRCDVLSSNPSLLPRTAQLVLHEIRRNTNPSFNETPLGVSVKQEVQSQDICTPRRQLSFAELLPHSIEGPYTPISLRHKNSTPNSEIQHPRRVRDSLELRTSQNRTSRAGAHTDEDDQSTAPSSDIPPVSSAKDDKNHDPGSPTKQMNITNFFKEKKITSARLSKPLGNGSQGRETRLLHVSLMSRSERNEFEKNLLSADEVACTLVYDDDSTQIRPAAKKRKRPNEERTKAEPVFISFALPWRKKQNGSQEKTTLIFVKMPLKPDNDTAADWTRKILGELMSSKSRKICYDAQALIKCLLDVFAYVSDEVCLLWKCYDLKIAAWLLDPDHPPKNYGDVMQMVELLDTYNKCEEYADNKVCRDLATLGPALVTIFHRLKSNSLWDLFWDLEMDLCPILAVMEKQGIHVNVQALLDASEILKKEIHIVESEAHKAAGQPFLINSTQQLREILFDQLKLDQKCKKKLAKTTTKNCTSTSESVLVLLQEFHPLPKLVLEYRQLVKLRSTYFDGILPFVKNGLLYTKWDHTAAATGRVTSTNPNLQCVPKQAINVTGVKKQFIAGKEEETIVLYPRDVYQSREGWSFLAADFQSIELRLLANLSDDPDLLRVFNDSTSIDIFTKLTSQWLGVPPVKVDFKERERTKRIVYSVIYGVGRERLGNTLCVEPNEAKGFMESFLGKFPGINEFSRKCIEDCNTNGFVSTIFKRKRWIPHIKSRDFQIRSQAERQAVNFVVQGSAADLCKSAMIQIVHALGKDVSLKARLLLQIHDELLLEVADTDIDRVKDLVLSIMTSGRGLCGNRATLKVPFPVTISVGKVWSQMKVWGDCTDG
ncbi:DNA polymerase nu isoform X2 [Nematostella vectensis]|uniref:DNA polymerase nu isoform X2 n=1 Tax=Nematostella vectensis TaxID=45351 RepID=UPI00207774E0|nr:DNA polymerase nu isoform X2 [Nematostella vectensis]